jgi:hypothetical protein
MLRLARQNSAAGQQALSLPFLGMPAIGRKCSQHTSFPYVVETNGERIVRLARRKTGLRCGSGRDVDTRQIGLKAGKAETVLRQALAMGLESRAGPAHRSVLAFTITPDAFGEGASDAGKGYLGSK